MKTNNRLIILLTTFLIVLPASLMAQNFVVKGSVIDASSKESMPYVNVGLYRVSDTVFMRGATTDEKGRFLIHDVKPDSYLVRIAYVGYQKHYQYINVKQDVDLGQLSLRPGTILQEVEVTATRPLFSMDGEKNIYNTNDDPSIQTGTASDALQNAPGIEIDADGNITLRGTQGVDVWINDRPSHMDGEALKQYIKMLPASSIERIEVISNPSARYGGGTPVVNIITSQKIQRNEFFSLGLNGSSRPDQGIWLSEMKPWMSYVFANEKFNFNIYANFGYNKRESEYHGSSIMRNAHGDTARVNNYQSKEQNEGLESYIGGHMSYTFNERNHMGAWYGVYPHFDDRHEWGRSERYDYQYNHAGQLISIINNSYEGTEVKEGGKSGGGYFGSWMEHRFDDSTGHKINFNINGNGWITHNNNQHERHYDVDSTMDIVREVDGYYRNFNVGYGVDYVRPFGNQDSLKRFANELNLGISGDISRTRNWDLCTWQQEGFLAGKADSIDKNLFSTANNISLYTTYQRRFGNLTAKVGLRGALSNSGINYINRPQYSLDSTFLTLTPSLHLSYSTKKMHNFSLSYTRRVSQPGVESLTLYREYGLDNYGSWGNPDLRPEYSQKIELQWDKYFVKFGSIGVQLYYSGSTDQVSTLVNVTYSDFYGAAVSYSQPMNIGNSYVAGLDLNATYRPTAFLNIRFNGSLVYNNEDFTFNEQQYITSQWSYQFRLNAWAKWNKNCQIFVNAHYGSPTKSIFTTTEARKGVDVGCNADFFDRKMTVNLNIHDIFNMNAWNSSNSNPYLSSTSNWKPMSRYVTLGITFRFGKMELSSMAQEGAESTEQSYR